MTCGVNGSFCSTLKLLSYFLIFLFHYIHNSPNEWDVFAVAMAAELNTRLRNQRCHGHWGTLRHWW